jgi:hypothetical protein
MTGKTIFVVMNLNSPEGISVNIIEKWFSDLQDEGWSFYYTQSVSEVVYYCGERGNRTANTAITHQDLFNTMRVFSLKKIR